MIFRRAIAASMLGLVIFPLFFSGCLSFRTSNSELKTFYETKGVQHKIDTVQTNQLSIRYVKTGQNSKNQIYFIHGSPGSLDAFLDYTIDSSLLSQSEIISIDRPGYGYSDFGRPYVDIGEQAKYLSMVIHKENQGQKIYLVGHSYAGPVIVKMAMDYPQLIDGLLILSGSISADHEPNEDWWRGPLNRPYLRWIIPKSFRIANDEIYYLREQLIDYELEFDNVICPVIMLHGTKDWIIDWKNVEFGEKSFKKNYFEYRTDSTASHFIPWTRKTWVTKAIIDLVNIN